MSLRLLNALRSPQVGVPLTLRQLEALTLEALIQRLMAMHLHLLALRIAAATATKADAVRCRGCWSGNAEERAKPMILCELINKE